MFNSSNLGSSFATFTAEQSSVIQQEISAIVKSPCFAGSKRCQDFLKFIVGHAIEGNYESLTERFLGAELFGRSIDYDTGSDSIVRVRANDVRRRLAQYYSEHHAATKVTIHLAPGTYIPEFQWTVTPVTSDHKDAPMESSADQLRIEPGDPPDVSLQQPAEAQLRQNRRPAQLLSIVAAITIGCCLGWVMKEHSMNRSLYPWKYKPAIRALWSGFLDNGHGTDIVLSDASFQVIQNVSKQTFDLDSYLNRSYIGRAEAKEASPAVVSMLNLIASKTFGNSGEFRLAQRILSLGWTGNGVRIYNARDYSSSLVTQDNIVLIGSEYTNPWQHLFEGHLNFIETAGTESFGPILNKAPKAGEQATYAPTDDIGYCVVAYLPSPDYSTKALLIEGSSAEATEAGGDFILSEDKLADFMQLLHVQKLPYFEVLLETSQAHGTPIAAKVAAYRIYPGRQ